MVLVGGQRALWVRWTAWTSSADGLPRAWPSPSSSQDAEDEQDKEDGTAVLTPLYAAEGVLSPASPDLQHHVCSLSPFPEPFTAC